MNSFHFLHFIIFIQNFNINIKRQQHFKKIPMVWIQNVQHQKHKFIYFLDIAHIISIQDFMKQVYHFLNKL